MRLSPLIIILAIIPLLGCMDQNDPGVVTPRVYDVVELKSVSDAGSLFTMCRDDGPVTLYTSTVVVNTDKVKVGESLVISYILQGTPAATPRPINLITYFPITNIKLGQAPMSDLEGWDIDKIFLISIWRSGTRINLEASLPVDGKPRQLGLIVDKATIDNPIPDLYLLHRREEVKPTYDSRYYISFDIKNLWNRSYIQGIRIHVADTNLPGRDITFMK